MSGPEWASDPGESGAVHRPPARAVEVAEFFDAIADTYDGAYTVPGVGGRTLRRRLETVLELLDDGPGEILDAGMGGAIVCRELARRGWSAAGTDLSGRMV